MNRGDKEQHVFIFLWFVVLVGRKKIHASIMAILVLFLAQKKCRLWKNLHFFSLVCYARLLSVGRLLLLRNVYLHAVGIKRALALYTPSGNKRALAHYTAKGYQPA